MNKLKKLLTIPVLAAVLCCGLLTGPVILTGCTSVNKAAFVSTGSIAVTVEAARQGFDDYLAAQKAKGTPVPLDIQRKVRDVWNQYQAALKTVTDAGKAYHDAVVAGLDTADYKAKLNLALAELGVVSGNFISVVQSLGIKF